MKKILILNTVGMGYEGISSVIINYLSNIDTKKFIIDIIIDKKTPIEFKNRLNDFGNTYVIARKQLEFKNYVCELNNLLKEKKYDVIHVHGNSGMMLIETLIAKKNGVKKIIVHCHNTTCDHKILNFLFKRPMKYVADILIACSNSAGKWLYNKKKYIVLNNAIKYERFKFDQNIRKEMRNKLGINNEFVIGHIGSFIEQKNHSYLIDIFYEYQKINSNSLLLLASDGPYLEKIKNKVSDLHIENKVIFAGRRSDVEKLYQAMDVFVMPSKWEGLPVVMLEAQACSLPLVVSDKITKDAKFTDDVYYLPIDIQPTLWALEIEKIQKQKINRKKDNYENLKKSGFDINTEAKKLETIYLS